MNDAPSLSPAAVRHERLAVWSLLALASLLLFPSLGVAPLERAEIYFLDVARAMLERGDWLVPYYRGQPFFDKPALTYWLMALSFEGFGFTAEAARLVPALATLFTILATLGLGALAVGRRAALVGGFVLVTTLAFVGFGRVAMSDSLLALWSTLSVWLGLCAYEGRARWAVPLLGVTLGCGFLTKGPVALLLPGLGLLLLMWSRRPARPPVTATRLAVALLLFTVCGLGWFGLAYARLGSQPLEYFFLRENLQRFAAQTYDSGRPIWYYLFTYMAQGAPWSLFLPIAAWRVLRPSGTALPGAQGARFLLGWLGLMLVPLSLSRGKLDYYLLPLYPAASLVVGQLLSSVPWRQLERAVARAAAIGLALGLLVGLRLIAEVPVGWRPSEGSLKLVTLGVVTLALLLCLAALRARPRALVLSLGASVSAVFLALTLVFLPAFRAGQPNARIVQDVAREKAFEPSLRLALCDDPLRVQRDVLFETRTAVDERCDLYAPISSSSAYLVLLTHEQWSLSQHAALRHVRSYAYLPATAYGLSGLLEGIVPSRVGLFANFATSDPVATLKSKRERRQGIRAEEQADEPPVPRRKKRRFPLHKRLTGPPPHP